ncbi:MAG: RNA methyltransferase [Eubacteriales bacterium]|nr:RNA methyltransferase [Eubacteriales bacterium]
MQTITSLRNPAVSAAKALQTKRGRDESGLFLCEGEHMVAEAIQNAPGDVCTVFVEESQAEHYATLLAAVPDAVCFSVPSGVLGAISQVKTPQGIAAAVLLPRAAPLDGLGPHVILLENVQDPGNVGTILRTLDAAGFDACVLTPGCADPYSAKALRATMGSVFRVPVARAASAAQAVNALKSEGYAVVAAVLTGEDFYKRESLPQKVCLVIGNEGAGIMPETEALCTHRYRLPMRGGAESLNAAVAAAVMMYELTQRG